MSARLLTVLLLIGCGSSESSEPTGGLGGAVAGGSGGSTTGTTGGAAGSSAGMSGASGSSGTSSTNDEYFITADIDGVTLNATMDVKASWFQGLIEGSISLVGTGDSRAWFFAILNTTGSDVCSGGYITLDDLTDPLVGSSLATFGEGGSCMVTVTQAAPNVGDVLEGRFEAVLSDNETTVTVTDGRFRALRAADAMPD